MLSVWAGLNFIQKRKERRRYQPAAPVIVVAVGTATVVVTGK